MAKVFGEPGAKASLAQVLGPKAAAEVERLGWHRSKPNHHFGPSPIFLADVAQINAAHVRMTIWINIDLMVTWIRLLNWVGGVNTDITL